MASIPIPGHGQSVTGIQVLQRPNDLDASFLTWTVGGNVTFWTLEGQVKASIDVPIGMTEPENELDPVNQLTCARTTNDGKLLISADRMGVLRMTDIATKEPVLDIKAHTADCRSVSVYDNNGKFLMASCGRDRTAQLFHRTADGSIVRDSNAANQAMSLYGPLCTALDCLGEHQLPSDLNEHGQCLLNVCDRLFTLVDKVLIHKFGR